VADVGASAEWYGRALGLEPYVDHLDLGYVALRHKEAKIVVVLTAASDPSPATASPGSAPGSMDHIAWAVPDAASLDSWAQHLTEIGIDHAGVVLENGNPSLQLRDPDGIAIELVAPGRRGPAR
jgi:catechol-2,3-dioxygenase